MAAPRSRWRYVDIHGCALHLDDHNQIAGRQRVGEKSVRERIGCNGNARRVYGSIRRNGRVGIELGIRRGDRITVVLAALCK
jgi:hypothetical protein